MRSTKRTIEEIVISYLEIHAIPKNSHIIAAYSGGPDSTALISALAGLSVHPVKLTAAYFNHRLRPEPELSEEIEIIRRQSEALGVKLYIGEAGENEIKSRAVESGLSLEEAARNARYSFLFSLRDQICADYIAVGHNADDNAETMLMRFLQNGGTSGLSGIPEKRGALIRPLYRADRETIEEYIRAEKLLCSLDKTNMETDFLRNRIRHEIIPVIKDVFPEFKRNMASLSEKLRADERFIMHETKNRIVWAQNGIKYQTSLENFNKQPLSVKMRSIFTVFNSMGQGARISSKAVRQAVEHEAVNGKVLLRVSDMELYTANGFIFAQRLVNSNKKSYLLYLKPGEIFSVSKQKFCISDELRNEKDCGMMSVEVITAGVPPVLARSYREGDKIAGENGQKSIKKLFSDWKVDPGDRFAIPIIEDSDGIAAVIGKHLGYRNKTACRSRNNGHGLKKILLYYSSDTETIGE